MPREPSRPERDDSQALSPTELALVGSLVAAILRELSSGKPKKVEVLS